MTYSVRNTIIRSLGYSSYAGYLQSLRWQAIRARVLKSSRKCATCPAVASEVHHTEYSAANLSGVSLDGLTPICPACHDLIEFSHGAKVLDLREVDRRWRLLQSFGYAYAAMRLEGIKPAIVARRTNDAQAMPRETLTGIRPATQMHARKKEYRSKWVSRK